MAKILRPYQETLKTEIYESWDKGFKNVLAVMPTGGGKCLGVDTPILLHSGEIKKVQDIQVGDLLMGPDSKPRVVLSTCKGTSELFEIIPIKGEPWTCNDVHILSLIHTETSEIIDIPINDYLNRSKNFKHLHKQFRVGVDFSENPIEFDPYLLGLYLAEGSYAGACITNPDIEVINYVTNWCNNEPDHKVNYRSGHGCCMIEISTESRKWGANKIRKLANYISNRDDRWIPKEYLVNSRDVRLKVLAGLIDGDGYYHQGGFEIITKYPSLNRDILFLARSLGFSAYSKKTIKRIKSIKFEGEYFRISIGGNVHEIPTLVKRKQAPKRKQIKDVLRTGFSVKSKSKGNYYGFTLDGDGRFLLGDFTVTHNTATFCNIAKEQAYVFGLPTAIEVHRKELVQQICLTLAEEGIPHNIIAPRPTILGIVAAERRLYGKQFYDYKAPITVISVDTLIVRAKKHEAWAKSIKFWIVDEAAHVLKANKWGRSLEFFPNAKGLGVTATPQRLDKRGLGRHADGVFDTMVQGPNTKWMIDQGFLSQYKCVVPASDYRDHLKDASEGHDYTRQAMQDASLKSHIVGDVVTNYIKFSKDTQAIVFADSIVAGSRMEDEFKVNGFSAKLLTGDTDDKVRLDSLVAFREREIKVLVNVDLFDEGLDVPGIETVIMARPTKSLGKYLQCVGRGLRPAKDKPYMTLIDHVGNIQEHGLPCNRRKWTLDRIVKRRDKVNLIRICKNFMCNSPFDRLLSQCPYCGHEDTKTPRGELGGRDPLKVVDGDLMLLDPETIRELEGDAQLEDPAKVAERVARVAGGPAGLRAMANQRERIEVQQELAKTVALWAGKMRDRGYGDRSIHKYFYLKFDMTITQALSVPKAEMLEIKARLQDEI